MPRDQFGRRIRPATAERERQLLRSAPQPRRALYLKLAAAGLALLAIGLAIAASQAR